QALAARIADLDDTSLRVALERDALPVAVDDAVLPIGQRVPGQILDLHDADAFGDIEGESFLGRELELARVPGLEVLRVEQLASLHQKTRHVDRFELGGCAGQRIELNLRRRYLPERALRIVARVEASDVPARQGDVDLPRTLRPQAQLKRTRPRL